MMEVLQVYRRGITNVEKHNGLPNAFRRIRLDLAREPGYPEGSNKIGYVFVAPLDEENRIDPQLWRSHRDDCRVVRFRKRNEDVGHLIHKPGGAWSFRYDVHGDAKEETGFHFGDESFTVGEYVSIKEEDKMHTFVVTSVEHV